MLVLALFGLAGLDRVEAQVAPDTPWRTLESDRIVTTFPAGFEETARRATALAERAIDEVSALLGPSDVDRVQLLLTTDTDASNGFARVAPFPRIVIQLAPPVDGFALSRVDDWLDLVITHEMVHVLHLDRTGTIGRVGRALFGSVPGGWPLYPGFAVPGWVIEGLATWYESRITGSGRVTGSDFRALLRTAALAGRLAGVDAASGDSPVWPAGQRRYVYGALFVDHLVRAHGEAAIERFVDAVAGHWIPWRIDAAARSAFGVSISDEWERWRAEVEDDARTVAAGAESPDDVGRTIASGTRYAVYPRARDGWLIWTEVDATDDPVVRRRSADGRIDEVRVNGLAVADLFPDGDLLVAQRELDGPWRDRTDLWRIDPATGASTRLTSGARVDQPSVAPDGTWAAAIRYVGAVTELVRVDLRTGEVVPLGSTGVGPARPGGGDPDAVAGTGAVGFPAVSPDGTRIALTRWTGEGTAVELRDARTGAWLSTVDAGDGLRLAPAWNGPDALLWSSDATGVPQIVGAPIGPQGVAGPVRAYTAVATAARFPAATREGGLVYALLHADGWELRERELGRAPTLRLSANGAGPDGDGTGPEGRVGRPARLPLAPAIGAERPYSVFGTLRPWYWEPVVTEPESTGGVDVVRSSVGARTQLADLVGRHVVDLEVSSSLDGEVSGSAVWSWAALGNPVFGLTASQSWDGQGPFTVERDSGALDRLVIRERVRRFGAFSTVRRSRWRSYAALTLEAGLRSERRELLRAGRVPEEEFSLVRPEAELYDVAATGIWSTARGAPVSISTEDGVTLGATVRRVLETGLADSLRDVRGRDRSRGEAIGSLRAYRSFDGPGFADHVLAVRAVGAATSGPGSGDFDWDVGGTAGSPEPVTGLELFGESATFGVRGFPRGARTGWRAWAASIEYRVPLAIADRGLGLIPVHLDRIHAALFADAGGAARRDGPAGDPIHSVGAELRTEWTLLFDTHVTVRGGVALPTDGTGGQTLYVRFGTLF